MDFLKNNGIGGLTLISRIFRKYFVRQSGLEGFLSVEEVFYF